MSQQKWETAAQAPQICVYIQAELPSCTGSFTTYSLHCRYVSLDVVSDLGAFPKWVTSIGGSRGFFDALTFSLCLCQSTRL